MTEGQSTMIQRPSSLLTPMNNNNNNNQRRWTRLGALFCLSLTAHFALIMSLPPTNTRFSNPNNNSGLRGTTTTRSKFELFRLRAKFELFGLESSASEESTVESLQAEQSESSKESDEETVTERKKFELFSLTEDEMRPKLSALAEESTTDDLFRNSTKEKSSAKVELALFASKDCQGLFNDTTTTYSDGVDRVHTDSSEPFHYIPSESISFVPKAARVTGDGIVALYTGRPGDSQDLKFKTNLQEGKGCVDLSEYISSHKTAQFTLYSSPALATRAQTAVA